jgi:hypothetical protein
MFFISLYIFSSFVFNLPSRLETNYKSFSSKNIKVISKLAALLNETNNYPENIVVSLSNEQVFKTSNILDKISTFNSDFLNIVSIVVNEIFLKYE